MKIRQTQKSWDNAIVKEKEAGVEDGAMIMKKVGDEEKVEYTEKVEENICDDGNKIVHQEIVADSTSKVKKNERSEIEQNKVKDDLEKDAVVQNKPAEKEKPQVRKTDERARVELILSAHALVTDVDNQGWSGVYL